MQELNRLRLVKIGEDGVRPLADAAILLGDDGQTVSLGITTLDPSVVVSADVDAELTAGMEREVRIDELVAEYRPTMSDDVLRSWAADLVSTLAARG
ncbi:hypothetical protein ACFZCP_14220 [Streptomyces sp. NPDC007971]|uniref:hypothetical protein n=1 Tax=Streptomyces sp. NPDC007971 TaxID=3364799 RepID=UPI0036E42732